MQIEMESHLILRSNGAPPAAQEVLVVEARDRSVEGLYRLAIQFVHTVD